MSLLSIALLAIASLSPETTATAAAVRESVMQDAAEGTRHKDVVLPLTRDSYTITLSGGSLHHIVVEGDGATDLDAYLVDGNGNVLALDENLTDFSVLRHFAATEIQLQLVIVNRGRRSNAYEIRLF
jgi:hypothetical protein